MKHYPKIKRLSSLKDLDMMFKDVKEVEVTEKIDGSNASFCLNESDNTRLDCFSRKIELNENSTLNGFYNWVHENVTPELNKLNQDYIYFGEWLVKHKIKYNDECYYKFYLFDIYDRKQDKWLNMSEKLSEWDKLKNINGIKKIFAIRASGDYIIKNNQRILEVFPDEFKINKSKEFEGVVIKIFDKLYNNEPCFFKIVNPKFEEIKVSKKVKEKPKTFDVLETICTEARVEKIILKMLVDTGELKDNDMYIENMPTLIKLIAPKVSADIFEEESELLEVWKKEYSLSDKVIEKTINRITPKYINGYVRRLENENSYF